MPETGNNLPHYASISNQCHLCIEVLEEHINYTVFKEQPINLIDAGSLSLNDFAHWQFLKLPFKQLVFLISNRYATLMLIEWSKNLALEDVLLFNTKKLNKKDWLFSQNTIDNEKLFVFAYQKQLNNLFAVINKPYQIKHAASGLLKFLDNNALYVIFYKDFMELIYRKDNQLQFHNFFVWDTPEDALYNVINSYKHLDLDTNAEPLMLGGNIRKEDKVYKLLYQYVKYLEFIDKPDELSIDGNKPFHNFVHHYASIL